MTAGGWTEDCGGAAARCLQGPRGALGVDLFILDLVDDSIHKEPILKHEEVGIDKKRRLGPALALQLRLHALELFARFVDRPSKTVHFLAHLFRPQFQIERNEKWIKASQSPADGSADGSHDTMYDSFGILHHFGSQCRRRLKPAPTSFNHPARYSQMLSKA